MKTIKPDKDSLRLIETILKQNSRILEVNAALLESLASPPIIVDEEIRRLRPGEISWGDRAKAG